VLIHHVATAADWAHAQETGSYATSTRGASLSDVGFLHAARADQVDAVLERYYSDAVEPLVLLTIETDLLDIPWREDPVGQDTFPHLYGPLSPTAVVAADSLDETGHSVL
jgi:uncharacterized protein (DUF952 family)